MNRRAFITLLGAATTAWPLATRAQQVAKIPRVGVIDSTANSDPFRQGLRDLGYIEGRNIAIEYRSAEGRPERLVAAATELTRLPVDIIVAFGSPATEAAKQATTTIPIVMAGIGDPVRAGFVASLAHPGGNITGNTILAELAAKRSFSNWRFRRCRVWPFSGIPAIPRMPLTSTSGKLPHRRWAWRCCLSRCAAPTSSTVPSSR